MAGSESSDPWHLLDLHFLFNPSRPKDTESIFKLEGPLHDRVVDMGNHLLSEEALHAAVASGQQLSIEKLAKEPLVRVFNFLREWISLSEFTLCRYHFVGDTALNLRMESLYSQVCPNFLCAPGIC